MKHKSNDYVIRVLGSPDEVNAGDWNGLLGLQPVATPFMRHEYLAALHASGSATPETGWTPRFIILEHGDALVGACALYIKVHSRGEYVFDRAWANAYAQHGLSYYPKAVVAVPFTPVPGTRLMARNAADRVVLAKALIQWCEAEKLSSLHLLFASEDDIQACEQAGMMLRHTVQFHWKNMAPTLATSCAALPPEGAASPWGGPAARLAPTLAASCAALPPEGAASPWDGPAARLAPTLAASCAALPPEEAHFALGRPGGETSAYRDFDDFLASLSQEKRKKIRQERRKVAEAGVTFRWSLGESITTEDWDFFYRCYKCTYLEHGNAPYLNRDFFRRMASAMPENWLLFVAERQGQPIATSLIAVYADSTGARGQNCLKKTEAIAYGRYWGALERVDCLHFEACYYQPLAWCIAHGYQRFEGGAQGEHKMARALLPVKTSSAHWLAHPAFADAVARFLEREDQGIDQYLDDLGQRSPFRSASNT